LVARVLPDQHVITSFHVQRDGFAVIVHATAASRDDFGLLRFFFGGIRDDDAADALFLFLNPLHEDPIAQRSYVHAHPPFSGAWTDAFYPLASNLMPCQAYDLRRFILISPTTKRTLRSTTRIHRESRRGCVQWATSHRRSRRRFLPGTVA